MNQSSLPRLMLYLALALGGYAVWRMGFPPAPGGASAGRVPLLDDASFDAALASATIPVLVDFYADWCAPCRRIAPVVAEIADRLEGRLRVYKVHVDASPKTANRMRVSPIPCLVLFRGGEEISRRVGAESLDAYLAWLEPHLPPPTTGTPPAKTVPSAGNGASS